jgi:hypothetical protein
MFVSPPEWLSGATAPIPLITQCEAQRKGSIGRQPKYGKPDLGVSVGRRWTSLTARRQFSDAAHRDHQLPSWIIGSLRCLDALRRPAKLLASIGAACILRPIPRLFPRRLPPVCAHSSLSAPKLSASRLSNEAFYRLKLVIGQTREIPALRFRFGLRILAGVLRSASAVSSIIGQAWCILEQTAIERLCSFQQ